MADKDSHNQPEQFHATLKGYSIGFVLSLLLTITAYISVVNDMLATQTLTIIIGLALVQLLVQLLFFLHLGKESKPRLNLTVFSFMLLVVGIIVIGSLWIMHNLDYNMMPKDMEKHMLEQYDQGSI